MTSRWSDTKRELVELKGRRIALRPVDEFCITPEYVGWLQDPEVVRFSNQRFKSHTRESGLRYLASFRETPNLFLAIYMPETGQMVGTMTAYVAEAHGTADLGILIGNRAAWGNGIGLDAWVTLMTFLFTVGRLRKVTGGTLRCNTRMARIMERSGMTLEGVRRRHELVDGQAQDVLLYAKFADV